MMIDEDQKHSSACVPGSLVTHTCLLTPECNSDQARSVPFEVSEWKVLTVGIDKFDVSLFVDWGVAWSRLRNFFEAERAKSIGSNGANITIAGRPAVLMPRGTTNRSYRIRFDQLELQIAAIDRGISSPNVSVVPYTQLIWSLGQTELLVDIRKLIQTMGGRVDSILLNRIDLCCDCLIPRGLPREFLESHQVKQASQWLSHMGATGLETFTVGGSTNPIHLRIYDKGKKVEKEGKNAWMRSIWNLIDATDVWRIEFQLRREALKEMGVNTPEKLQPALGGIWKLLTEKWFTLRLPGGRNVTRRPLHPLWADVQGAGNLFGPATCVSRAPRVTDHSHYGERYLPQIAGYVESFSAAEGITDPKAAVVRVAHRLLQHWSSRDFRSRVIEKATRRGIVRDWTGPGASRVNT